MVILNVTNSNDSGEGSLREAIDLANEQVGIDTILVETDVELESSISITDSLYLGTPYGATISQTGGDRIFTIDDGDDEDDISVGFHRINLNGGRDVGYGGAIYNAENLMLHNVDITGNSALQGGGGIYHTNGKLSVIDSLINENNTESEDFLMSYGGGIYVENAESYEIANSSVSDNKAIVGSSLAVIKSDGNIYSSVIKSDFDEGGTLDIADSYLAISSSSFEGNALSSRYNIINYRNSAFSFDDVTAEIEFNYEIA